MAGNSGQATAVGLGRKKYNYKIIHFKQLSGKISLFSIFYESKYFTLSSHDLPIVNFDAAMLTLSWKGKDRKGKERKGKERKGKERKGKERKGKGYCVV
jgi:hypothetical protein